MTPQESPLKVAAGWLAIAADDLASACVLGAQHPRNAVFLCQQAAEKAIKALLTAHDIPFRKTHNLAELGELGRHIAPRLTAEFERCSDLTAYAVAFRYFEAPYEPDAAEAADALARATALFDAIKAELNLP